MQTRMEGTFSSRHRLIADIVLHPVVQIAVILWVVAHVAVVLLSGGHLPFDRPALAEIPFTVQLASPTLGMVEIFLLMGVVHWLTRKRVIPDIAARSPARSLAARETLALLAYATAGQIGGWIIGPALGYRPFSFHIAGTLFGCSTPPSQGEIWTWAIYNFLVFAVLPYLWFRRRYDATELNLRSTNRRNDVLVIVVVCLIESAFELGVFDGGLLRLDARQILLGAPLAFALFFIGTVLPTMVLIYAILIPRYLKLTGSATTTVLLGGLTYAFMHLVEGWSAFDSPRDTVLSLIFVVLGYVGPGMIKTFITLRTGNAWVHALGYHAVAPHMIIDTPLIVQAFGIR
ncbi:hypothetical protein SAMN05444161_5801 [Rhizobiales bacterium GAS191]|nr:hypothetical protein SAMN05444161_5801 [Rhizobiales bacterium GAS191]